MSINRVAISGNLTRDPELRVTTSGSQVMTFCLAVNDRRRNPQSGEWEDVPNYVDCVLFGARAESLSKILTKGQRVVLDGRLRWSQWERDGQKRSKLEVIAETLDFVSPRRTQAPTAQGGYGSYAGSAPAAADYGNQSYGAPQQAPYAAQSAAYAPAPAAPAPAPAAPMDDGYSAAAPIDAAMQPPAADAYSDDIPF